MTFLEIVARVREKRREGAERMRAQGHEPATGLRLVDGRGRTLAEGRAFSVLAWAAALAYLTPPLAARRQTYGERLVGIEFISASGRRLGPVHAVARHVALDLAQPLLLALPPAAQRGRLGARRALRTADLACALVDGKNRSLMDRVMRTRAVHESVRPGA